MRRFILLSYTSFMQKILLLLTLVFSFYSLSQGQNNPPPPVSSANSSTTSVMPIGNSGAMANQTHQVDLSTGGVSLSIPIYNLGGRQLSTSVSLSYQTPTSSFWYNEYPSSWVGRDWVLNAGGVITKEIYPNSISDTTIFPIYPRDRYDYWADQLFKEGEEHRPSVYYYNFDGYAGRFIVIHENGEDVAVTIPQSDLKIVPHNFGNNQRAWTIYTPNGTVYTFGGDYVETTNYDIDLYGYYVRNTGYLGSEELHYRPGGQTYNSVSSNTSWYLNKISTPYSNDSIIFEYGEPYSSSLEQATVQHFVDYETGKEDIRKYKVLSGEIRNQRRISKIISLTGSIEFYETEESLIKNIEVKNKYDELIHKYHLNYQRKDDDHFLVSLQEKIIDCIQKPPYRFEYLDINGTQIGQDPDYASYISWDYLPGGLQRIIYPEGGHTKFVYEANRADVSEWEYKNVEERIVLMRDTYDTLDVRHIEVDHAQNIHVRASHYLYDYKLTIKNTAGLIIASQIITDSLDFFVPVIAGKYKIIIDHRNTEYSTHVPDVIVHLKWKQKWLEPNTNVNAKGWRIKKVITHDGIDATKNIVKTYKYELDNGNSSGRLIAPPLRFPENTSDYEWEYGNFDAYAYNYYMYESKTSLEEGDYRDLNIDCCPAPGYGDPPDRLYNYYNLGVPEYYYSYYHPTKDTLARLKTYKVYTALPNYLKGATQIQYTKVTEQYGENAEQGYVENYFSYQPNEIVTSAPMFTTRDNAWKRGLPIQTKVFDKDGKIILETTNEYEFSNPTTHPTQHSEVNTLSIIQRTTSYNPIANLYYPNDLSFYYRNNAQLYMVGHHFGKEVAGSIFLKQTTTTNYDQDHSGNSITSSTEYEYSDKHLFPIRVIQHENNGDKTISESKYVLDYDLDQTFTQDEAAGTLKAMKNQHIISPVIEQTVWKQKAGQAKRLLGASLTTYKITQTSILENNYMTSTANYKYYFSLMPSATYSFEPTTTGQPISEDDFTFSSITSTGFNKDNRYKKRVEYLASDRYGNLLSTKEVNGVPSTTLWGYNRLFPVAQIAGASHRQVAYEGFESYGEENQYPDLKTDAVFRGKYSSGRFTGNYIEGLPLGRRYLIYPSVEPIPKGNYTFSFWAKGSGIINIRSTYNDYENINFSGSEDEWTYYEQDIFINNNELPNSSNQNYITYVVSGNLNLDMRIDEIRFHPKNSFMTTTTYKPLVGVTHTTDAEQRTSSYYYDPLRRVESVRDHKNNLIKSYEYKYMSEDDNPNPLFSISTNPTPEALINTSITALVNQTDFNRCLNANQAYKHKWDFGDGSVSLIDNSIVSNKPHIYQQAGTYVITLSVEVVAGYWVDAHTSIRIIDTSAPSDVTNELTVTLGGTQDTTNPLCYDLVATPSGGTAPFTYEWLPGDGTSVPMQTGATLHYCYTTFGNFAPRVIVTDATGATADAIFDVTITNPIEPLNAEIISNDEFCRGNCAFFEANVTGGSPTYTYLWEIVNPLTNGNVTLGTTASLSFKVPNPTPSNQYTIYLTVTDSEGRQVTTTKTVTVLQDVVCGTTTSTGGFTITRNSQTISPTSIIAGYTITFTSPYTGNGYTYNWEIVQDGDTTTFTTQTPSLPINFPTEGNYTITCSVVQRLELAGYVRELPVGSNTIQISICNALNLPRY